MLVSCLYPFLSFHCPLLSVVKQAGKVCVLGNESAEKGMLNLYEPECAGAKLLRLCLTLCNPKNCQASVHGTLKARILE